MVTYSRMVREGMFAVVKNWKLSKDPPKGVWANKL